MSINTKSRIILKFLISLTVGTLLALVILTRKGIEKASIWFSIENVLYNHTIYIYIISAVLFLLPALVLFLLGKKAFQKMMTSDDDHDDVLRNQAGYLDTAMSMLSIFTAINFMQYGVLYHKTTENPTTILSLFMLGILFTAVLQVSIVKSVQKNDSRLKGDPTKVSFNKEFLQSMDEAEQLKVYKTGFKAFQLTKSMTLILIVISIFMNIVAETGGFAIVVSCIFMIVQIVSFMYYEKRTL